MKAYEFNSFSHAIEQASHYLHYRSKVVHSDRWQGSDITNRPEMATHEVAHVSFCVDMPTEELDHYREDIKPNLPWADDHFEERVCGAPINPGIEWKNWPYGKSAASFLDKRGMFNHNYMQRYWPKHANACNYPTTDADQFWDLFKNYEGQSPNEFPLRGIMYEYGDLNDVVKLIAEDPFTRQAYLPVWFPEDTGGGSKRAPCTIGYHFLMREQRLNINYHIRSCDFVRHFRDDLYLTARLNLWVLDRCREIDPKFREVRPGKFHMQIGSLHVFRNDFTMLFGNR